jgi:hypothetical protein
MKSPQTDGRWHPRPEELAAYADGELDRCPSGAALKQRIEDWFADHPEGVAEIESISQLDNLFKSTLSEGPAELAWSELGDRIQKELLETPVPPRRKAHRSFWAATFLAIAAAAVLLAFNLNTGPTPTPKEGQALDEEPFPVASADEVEILRVDGNDTNALVVGQLPVTGLLLLAFPQDVEILQVNGDDTESLVVGELPVQGSLELAQAGDVKVKSVEPARDQMKPKVQVDQETPPMVWAPLPTEGNE